MIRLTGLLIAVLLPLMPPADALAQLLLPLDVPLPPEHRPDITVLEEKVEIVIRDEHATTRVVQVLRNHTGRTLEGTYVFPLPQGGAVSDFATWDDGIRIPGVILEREEARRIYNSIVRRRIDPGLVEEQEGNLFSVDVFPIPPHGTKRLELEFTQLLDVDSGGVRYLYPLANAGRREAIDTFRLDFTVESTLPITGLNLPAETLAVAVDSQSTYRIEGHLAEQMFLAEQDFAVEYLVQTEGLGLRALSYHDGQRDELGFFLASMLPSMDLVGEQDRGGRDIVLMFDTSYSMMGEGLEGSLEAAREAVASLGSEDRVAVLAFNDQVHLLEPELAPAGAGMAAKVEQLLRTVTLGAGTDLEAALIDGLAIVNRERSDGRQRALVMITDGHQTVGDIDLTAIEERVMAAHSGQARIFSFTVGQGTEDPLLQHLTERTHGHFEHVRGYGDLSYRLARFLEKLDLPLVTDIQVKVPGRTEQIYPGQLADTFVGSRLLAVGRYKRSVRGNLKVEARLRGAAVTAQQPVHWSDDAHGDEYIGRLWARARVDYLLERIHVDGYREEWRDEIVELSRKYKFVTPYTSFLAAPRALLRPRVIKPGDPVLHIRAPHGTERVNVVFPFGETKPAVYEEDRGLWVCRFLVPVGMEDGSYDAIIVLTDEDGRQVRERKRFVIDSLPPDIRVSLPGRSARAGDELEIRVDAPPDTGHIVATLMRPDGREVLKVPIRWDDDAGINTGRLSLPEQLPAGPYSLFVHATDFAYNETGRHTELEVL